MKDLVFILLITLIFWPFAILISAFIAPPGVNWATLGLLNSLYFYPIPILIAYGVQRYNDYIKKEKSSKWLLLSLLMLR